MITFSSRVTKKGNLKVSPQVLEILGAEVNDCVVISTAKSDISKSKKPNCCSDCIHIPQEILETADIDAQNGLEVFAEEGRVIVQEIDD